MSRFSIETKALSNFRFFENNYKATGILARRKLFCTKPILQNSKISICKLHETFLHLAQMVGCVRLKLLLDLAQIVVCVRSKDHLLCANITSCKYPKDLCAVAHNLFCKQRQCFVVFSTKAFVGKANKLSTFSFLPWVFASVWNLRKAQNRKYSFLPTAQIIFAKCTEKKQKSFCATAEKKICF